LLQQDAPQMPRMGESVLYYPGAKAVYAICLHTVPVMLLITADSKIPLSKHVHKIVFVKDFSGRQLILDKNLAELEADIDPKNFFRLNRKFIANMKSIERFKPDNGKIRVFLQPEMKEEIFVSKETAPEFRLWIEGK
jgi:DNA-binding LytR/AlgR family response regulator